MRSNLLNLISQTMDLLLEVDSAMIFSETRVYSPAQAASVLGVSTERIRQLGHAGRLPYAVTPLGRLFDADAVDALAAGRVASRERSGQHGRR